MKQNHFGQKQKKQTSKMNARKSLWLLTVLGTAIKQTAAQGGGGGGGGGCSPIGTDCVNEIDSSWDVTFHNMTIETDGFGTPVYCYAYNVTQYNNSENCVADDDFRHLVIGVGDPCGGTRPNSAIDWVNQDMSNPQIASLSRDRATGCSYGFRFDRDPSLSFNNFDHNLLTLCLYNVNKMANGNAAIASDNSYLRHNNIQVPDICGTTLSPTPNPTSPTLIPTQSPIGGGTSDTNGTTIISDDGGATLFVDACTSVDNEVSCLNSSTTSGECVWDQDIDSICSCQISDELSDYLDVSLIIDASGYMADTQFELLTDIVAKFVENTFVNNTNSMSIVSITDEATIELTFDDSINNNLDKFDFANIIQTQIINDNTSRLNVTAGVGESINLFDTQTSNDSTRRKTMILFVTGQHNAIGPDPCKFEQDLIDRNINTFIVSIGINDASDIGDYTCLDNNLFTSDNYFTHVGINSNLTDQLYNVTARLSDGMCNILSPTVSPTNAPTMAPSLV